MIKEKLNVSITKLYNIFGGGLLSFSLLVYGNNVEQEKKVSEKYMEIIGGSYPNHFVSLDGLSEE